MNLKKKLSIGFLVMALVFGLGFASVPTAKAQFTLAAWDYPDEYGQGIATINIEHNTTGSWLPSSWVDATRDYDESSEVSWNVSIFIKLTVRTWFNSTLTGSSDFTEGKNHHRHNITVTRSNGTIVFSQSNFTYGGCYPAINPPMWLYYYDVILNFLPEYGEIYTVTITYEVFY
jgi:hypothetical protein